MNKKFLSLKRISVHIFTATILLFNSNDVFAVNCTPFNKCSLLKDLPTPQYQNKIGTFSVDFTRLNINKQELLTDLNSYFGLNSHHSFKLQREYSDNLENTYYNFMHYYNDVEVEGNAVFVQVKNDKIQYVSGQMFVFKDFNTVSKITDDKVKEIAYQHLGISENVTEGAVENLVVKIETEETVTVKLVKKINLTSILPLTSKDIYIDAQNGNVLYDIEKVHKADTQSTSTTLYRGTQSITVDSYSGSYRLKDNARNIHTKNGSGLDGTVLSTGELKGATEYTNSTANFTGNATKPAVEVHWGMAKTYDYYKNIHNRNSYDGQGSIVRNYYNPPSMISDADNAGALDGQGIVGMVYGAGAQYFSPVVALDVAGHEYSHLVVSRNGSGGLNYQGESGALNESFADMFGTAIEFYVNNNPNWTIGEGLWKVSQVTPNYMRSLSDPNSAPAIADLQQPDTYKGTYWASTTSAVDNGGVHINSGVGNHWFYLLSVGGTGVNDLGKNYYVNPITIQKAEKIAYKALTSGLSKTAKYIDVYNATKTAAATLYGANSNEWEQVVNAWYAVGIGDAPASTTNYEMQSKLKVYPNPTTGDEVTIESNLTGDVTVEIFDLSGKKVLAPTMLQNQTTINVSAYKTGIYLLKFKSNEGEYSHKLMIK